MNHEFTMIANLYCQCGTVLLNDTINKRQQCRNPNCELHGIIFEMPKVTLTPVNEATNEQRPTG